MDRFIAWVEITLGIGDGTHTDSFLPVRVQGLGNVQEFSSGSNHVCIREQGSMKCWGRNGFGQLGIILR